MENDRIKAIFADGVESDLPHVWLRDNCQCPLCFCKSSLGRKMLLNDLDLNIHPMEVRTNGEGDISVTWNDGHHSEYDGEWLYNRSFNPKARNNYRSLHRLAKVIYRNIFYTYMFNNSKIQIFKLQLFEMFNIYENSLDSLGV